MSSPYRKPIIPGWKTVNERENTKPAPRTQEEIAQAHFSYGSIKDEAPGIVKRAIERGWAIHYGGIRPSHWANMKV